MTGPWAERKQAVERVREQVALGRSPDTADAAQLLAEQDLHMSLVDRLADRYIGARTALGQLVDSVNNCVGDCCCVHEDLLERAEALLEGEEQDPGGVVARLRAIETAAEAVADDWLAMHSVQANLLDALVVATKNGENRV